MAKNKNKSKRKLKALSVVINLEKALGKGHREAYIEENPHGFKASKKIHKNKNAYSRKSKHKKSWS